MRRHKVESDDVLIGGTSKVVLHAAERRVIGNENFQMGRRYFWLRIVIIIEDVNDAGERQPVTKHALPKVPCSLLQMTSMSEKDVIKELCEMAQDHILSLMETYDENPVGEPFDPEYKNDKAAIMRMRAWPQRALATMRNFLEWNH